MRGAPLTPEARQKGQFKPGQSGNPHGRRPVPKCIPDLLRKLGRERIPRKLRDELADVGCSTRATKLEAILRRVYKAALAGEAWAVQFIAERTEGKVKDTVAIEGGARLEIVEEIVDAHPAPPPV